MSAWRDEVIWAAGLFEGEGCLSVYTQTHRHDYKLPRATLATTDRDVLDRFQRAVGFGRIGAARKPQKSHYKPSWTWRGDGYEKVQALVAMFWPWLGSRRLAKAKQVIGDYQGCPAFTKPVRFIHQCTTPGCLKMCRIRDLCQQCYKNEWARNKLKENPKLIEYLTQ